MGSAAMREGNAGADEGAEGLARSETRASIARRREVASASVRAAISGGSRWKRRWKDG